MIAPRSTRERAARRESPTGAPRPGVAAPAAGARPPRGARGLTRLLTAAFVLLPLPAQAVYDDASVHSILLNRDRAEALQAPLVLLAHETTCHLAGGGARTKSEHLIWFVADPQAPVCQAVQQPRIRLDLLLERLELHRARIYRSGDTLEVAPAAWHSTGISGWPEATRLSWTEASAELPPLEKGDLVELAYTIHNRWSASRQSANWEVIPIANPLAPTVERHIVLTSVSLIDGQAVVLGDAARLIRHHGTTQPRLELLTGNLPPAPADPLDLHAPRLLYSAETDWRTVQRALVPHYGYCIQTYEEALAAAGDSILAATRTTRERLAGVLEHIERRWTRVPRSLPETRGFPRLPPAALTDRASDPLDRAILAAGLAGAAHLKVSLFFGASTAEGFRTDLATPQQFDRVLLGVPLLEEGRYLIFDPWQTGLEAAESAASGVPVLFGISEDVAGFREVGSDGRLHERQMP